MMGKVIMSGIVPQLLAPATGIKASDLAVGSVVKLMENGSPAEYLVVNQGVPANSSLYDASCNGTWLLRKDLYAEMSNWRDSSDSSYNYPDSIAHEYLNTTFLSSLDEKTQEAIVRAKIPYCKCTNGPSTSMVYSGSSGLSTKAFLLSCREVGFSSNSLKDDGVTLDYFESGYGDSANTLRIAYYNGNAKWWWLRSVASDGVYFVGDWGYDDGGTAGQATTGYCFARPALILDHTAVFDEETLVLKGVS